MKAKEAVNAALTLLFHVNESGAVEENRERRYFGAAPAYLTLLQYELASLLNLPPTGMAVTELNGDLALSDSLCRRVLPAGLAMYFALTDRDDASYNHFSKLYYETLVPSVKPCEAALTDTYGVRGDPTMR